MLHSVLVCTSHGSLTTEPCSCNVHTSLTFSHHEGDAIKPCFKHLKLAPHLSTASRFPSPSQVTCHDTCTFEEVHGVRFRVMVRYLDTPPPPAQAAAVGAEAAVGASPGADPAAGTASLPLPALSRAASSSRHSDAPSTRASHRSASGRSGHDGVGGEEAEGCGEDAPRSVAGGEGGEGGAGGGGEGGSNALVALLQQQQAETMERIGELERGWAALDEQYEAVSCGGWRLEVLFN